MVTWNEKVIYESKGATFSLKGKDNIWWEYLKNSKGINKKKFPGRNLRNISRTRIYLRDIVTARLRSFMSSEWDKLNMRSIPQNS